MQIRNFLIALIVSGAVASASTVHGGEVFGRISSYWRTPTPYYVGNPKLILPKSDAPSPLGRYSREPSPSPHAYPYGYFGAQTHPYAARSFGYYNDYSQTSYGWGY